jgi:D-alanyl-D-alanine carboxypeptidase (penicillin-binding protein 5/6)
MLVKKLAFIVLLPFCLFFLSAPVSARHAAILIDADNGNVLYELESTQPWYPASLTKAMTLYMVFDALKRGQIQLQDTMSASYHASRQPNSKLGLHVGDTITVEEAILAIITRSANDAAVVLAEHIGGSEDNFAAKMTSKSHNLGMIDSHFMNATGLPDNWQTTTAKDMATLGWKIYRDFPEYYPYFAAPSLIFNGRELKGINKFTAHYPGAEGMKTGFTCGSGYNLLSSASQDSKRYIGVVLGGSTSSQRYQLMMDMMDQGFQNPSMSTGQNIATMPAGAGGTPPYLLGCGKGAGRSMAVDYDAPDVHPAFTKYRTRNSAKKIVTLKHNHKANIQMTRSLAKLKSHAIPKSASSSKSVSKVKVKPVTKSKTIAKPKAGKGSYRHANHH